MDWQKTTTLVTGAGGFIGSHLVESLVKLGAKTRALIHYNSMGHRGALDGSPYSDNIHFVVGDIRDSVSVRRAMDGVDVVFHLAALVAVPYSYVAPASYIQTNIEGTLNVLQAARDLKVRTVVHTSTSEVYGTARYVPMDEGHPLQAQSPYSASKIGADKLSESFYLSFGLPIVTVRPFNTFGPRQSARAVIPAIITQCLSGHVVRLGSLYPTRDLNYVQNTVDGMVAAAVSPSAIGRTINLGSGREVSIEFLAQLAAKMIGKEIVIEGEQERLRPENSEVDRLLADNTLARQLLDWQPAITLEEGLTRTIEWIRENIRRYRPGDYML